MSNPKSKLTIFIPIEVKVRELISKLLISYKLINIVDCKIIIGSQRLIFSRYKDLKNIIWLDKHTFHSKLKNYTLPGSVKFMLDEEGPLVWNYGVWNKIRFNAKIINFYNKIILHGRSDQALLKKYNKKKFLVYGHPKYDIIKNYKKIFYDEAKKIKNKEKKFILIVSSFSYDGYAGQDIENEIIKINTKDSDFLKYLKNHHKDKSAIHENYFNLIYLTIKLAEELPSKNIIFRPHPTQNIDLVKERFPKNLKNIKVVYNKTVTPWIMACSFFIHSGCSTYIEAYLFKKKIINIYKKKYKNFREFNHAGPTFFDADRCIKFIKNNLNKELKFSPKKNKMENILINLKNANFSDYFAEYIKKNYSNLKSLLIKRSAKKNNTWFKLKKEFFLLLSLIKNKIILKTYFKKFLPQHYFFSKDYKIKKFNYLHKSEISSVFKKFSEIDKKKNFLKKISISKVCQDVYEIKNITKS